MLPLLVSSFSSLDSCGGDIGIHYIFIGDSVTRQHFKALYNSLTVPNEVTMINLDGTCVSPYIFFIF